jgi:hypothetical protein
MGSIQYGKQPVEVGLSAAQTGKRSFLFTEGSLSLASCDAEAVGEEMTPELSVMTNISRAGREPKPLPLVGDPRF